jgi:hypothetical protein
LDDCDDGDSSLGDQGSDQDCDGILTDVDCDDSDPGSGDIAFDGDCDGFLTSLDCNDSDFAVNPDATEVCDDGIDNNCDGKGCMASSSLSLALEWTGEASYDASGSSVGGGCDFNADNYDDFMVGAYQNDDGGTDAGAAYLILGSDYSSMVTSSPQLSSHFEFKGESHHDYAGFSVACVGDVNNDSYDDFMIGAYGQGASYDLGAAYLILGNATPSSYGLDSAIKYTGKLNDGGGIYGEEAGYAVGSGGDVNSDGYEDIIVGAPKGESYAGAAYLVLGSTNPSSANLQNEIVLVGETNSRAGWAVAGNGDVNGDGFDDLLIGAPYYDGAFSGAAYLVPGDSFPDSTNLADHDTYTGPNSYMYAGSSVAISGDANGDGYSDLFVGAVAGGTSYGEADLILGSAHTGSASLASGIRYKSTSVGAGAGYSVAYAGDIDSDGFDDLLVGAKSGSKAYLILGSPAPSSANLTSHIELSGVAGGLAVSAAGDVDGDGNDDILVGEPRNNDSYTQAGASYLVFGIGL